LNQFGDRSAPRGRGRRSCRSRRPRRGAAMPPSARILAKA